MSQCTPIHKARKELVSQKNFSYKGKSKIRTTTSAWFSQKVTTFETFEMFSAPHSVQKREHPQWSEANSDQKLPMYIVTKSTHWCVIRCLDRFDQFRQENVSECLVCFQKTSSSYVSHVYSPSACSPVARQIAPAKMKATVSLENIVKTTNVFPTAKTTVNVTMVRAASPPDDVEQKHSRRTTVEMASSIKAKSATVQPSTTKHVRPKVLTVVTSSATRLAHSTPLDAPKRRQKTIVETALSTKTKSVMVQLSTTKHAKPKVLIVVTSSAARLVHSTPQRAKKVSRQMTAETVKSIKAKNATAQPLTTKHVRPKASTAVTSNVALLVNLTPRDVPTRAERRLSVKSVRNPQTVKMT
tara:strand:- start:530 stop:1597 length:1068 start_codon:yes stop_codon:yes gene_type:complete